TEVVVGERQNALKAIGFGDAGGNQTLMNGDEHGRRECGRLRLSHGDRDKRHRFAPGVSSTALPYDPSSTPIRANCANGCQAWPPGFANARLGPARRRYTRARPLAPRGASALD